MSENLSPTAERRAPRVVVIGLASCFGCQINITNIERHLMDVLGQIDLGYWQLTSSVPMPDEFDVAVIEGAVTTEEAEAEATFVLEQIRNYQVTWPIAFFWEYDTNDDGSQDQSSRTIACNGEQVTSFIKAFCDKIELAGFTASYYADKTMAYETLQLDQLTSYDLWYAEYRAQPGFYYDFGMWQYTDEGTVSGISGSVPITLSFKNYPSLR